jgi:hypothetical protein
VPFELYHVRRAFTVMLVLVGVVAVGLTWAQVARKIADAKPPSSPVGATSVVWGDLVFQTPPQLETWLRVHGVAYSVWSGRHAYASSALEHRPLRIARQGPPPKPAAPESTAAPKSTVAPKSAAGSTSPTSSPGGLSTKTLLIAVLALLAAAAAIAAASPAVLRYRYPTVARGLADHRDLLLACAAAVMIGIITGVVLN